MLGQPSTQPSKTKVHPNAADRTDQNRSVRAAIARARNREKKNNNNNNKNKNNKKKSQEQRVQAPTAWNTKWTNDPNGKNHRVACTANQKPHAD